MKAAVRFLEPFMERRRRDGERHHGSGHVKATCTTSVRICGYYLTNNGYRVINLGIKQRSTHPERPERSTKADAIA